MDDTPAAVGSSSSDETRQRSAGVTMRGGAGGEASLSAFRRLRHMQTTWGAVVPLLALWVALSLASPYFLTTANLTNILLQAAIIGVLAFGSTVAMIAEEIDLSIGALEGFTAVVAAIVIVWFGQPWVLGVLAAVGCGAALGLMNGVVTTFVGIPSFITTLATLGMASGLALTITEGNAIYGFPDAYLEIGRGRVLGLPISALIAVAVLLSIWFVLRFTPLGLRLYAVGGSGVAASELGLGPRRIKTFALTVSGACAGIAGVLVSARLNAANGNFGQFDLLDAIAAVVIGGTALTGGVGSVVGTAFGVLIIVSIRNGLDLLGVSPFWQTAAVGAMILAAAILHRLAARRS
jgi:ribose/xylose/arabinose/galactoside ABC-type transport system permease subunit